MIEPVPAGLLEAEAEAETELNVQPDTVMWDVDLGAQSQLLIEIPLPSKKVGKEAEFEPEISIEKLEPFLQSRSKHITVDIPQSTLLSPRSCYSGFTPPAGSAPERVALETFLDMMAGQDLSGKEEFLEFELTNFSIYVDGPKYRRELRSLLSLCISRSHQELLFDGVLSYEGRRFYLKGVPFTECPIGNYGASYATVGKGIWIRSSLNVVRQNQIYYTLQKPATEYARFYYPFVWVADLAKHAIDFMEHMTDQDHEVTISCFRKAFVEWLLSLHGQDEAFQRWYQQHWDGGDDFRGSFVANVDFIWKELSGQPDVFTPSRLELLTVFKEVGAELSQYKLERPLRNQIQPTSVTPYIMECFEHMVMGKILRVPGQGRPNGLFAAKPKPKRREVLRLATEQAILEIKQGDVISTARDEEDSGTKWRADVAKDAANDSRWFALVQKVHVGEDDSRSFDITWLYRPVDTPCCIMRYPYDNELFLSDHCTCEEPPGTRIHGEQILRVHEVHWSCSGNPDDCQGRLFVRQTYMTKERRWITFDESHKKCVHTHVHEAEESMPYRVGDAVLVAASADRADPFEILEVFKLKKTIHVRLKKLLRRKEVDPTARHAKPNELIYVDYALADTVVIKAGRITGKCIVRFFGAKKDIPCPYNRDGVGNIFFITHKKELVAGGEPRIVPLEAPFPSSLRQGFDPHPRQQGRKLRGLDLFCGGGNFGRGLEEGGAVEMRWANDLYREAIHTYMANAPNQDITHPFFGTIDDLVRLALAGKFSKNVPKPGEVEFISAGSPCPGFSRLTSDKTTLKQVKNQSLVASFASLVDFYRPKYGILENVTAIVQPQKDRHNDVFSQLLCAIVGMGYQAQMIHGDAWSYGSPQRRERIFLYFAAPGQRLPDAPLPSHSHPPAMRQALIGRLCNGEPFVTRSFKRTAFKFISAGEAMDDLPRIDDTKVDTCVAFPDHRLSCGFNKDLRAQLQCIPIHPYGMNFVSTWRQGKGIMTKADRELFHLDCTRVGVKAKGWGRVVPTGLVPTITTYCQPTDARIGRQIHWTESRPLTIMEARRSQGLPDDEVLLGLPRDKWKIVGNSVPRQIALALGLQFREAWYGTLDDQDPDPVTASSSLLENECLKTEAVSGLPPFWTTSPFWTTMALKHEAEEAAQFIPNATGTPKRSSSNIVVEISRLSKRQKKTRETSPPFWSPYAEDDFVSPSKFLPAAADLTGYSIAVGLSQQADQQAERQEIQQPSAFVAQGTEASVDPADLPDFDDIMACLGDGDGGGGMAMGEEFGEDTWFGEAILR